MKSMSLEFCFTPVEILELLRSIFTWKAQNIRKVNVTDHVVDRWLLWVHVKLNVPGVYLLVQYMWSGFSDFCEDIFDASCKGLPELATYALASRGDEDSHIHTAISHTAGWKGCSDGSMDSLSSVPFLLLPDTTHIIWRVEEKSQKALIRSGSLALP